MILYYLITIYLISAISGWIYLHIYYSPEGLRTKIENPKPINGMDVFLILMPVVNLVCLFLWIQNPKTGKYIITVKQFFNIKD